MSDAPYIATVACNVVAIVAIIALLVLVLAWRWQR